MSSVKKQLLVLGVAHALVCLSGASVFAAKAPSTGRSLDKMINASMQYAFPAIDGQSLPSGEGDRTQRPVQLGAAAPSASPGLTVGNTWWDVQHNGRMGRMNETRTGAQTIGHFSWMYLSGSNESHKSASYANYDFTTHSLLTPFMTLQPSQDNGGWVNLDVTNDNRAVVAFSNSQAADGRTDIEVYWEFTEGSPVFAYQDSVPAALSGYPDGLGESYWPTISFVEGPDDTITHIFGFGTGYTGGDAKPLYYFRRVGASDNPAAAWDYPPYVVDTIFNEAAVVEATDAGRVALAWIANVPCSYADPDTASCDDGIGLSQWDNDLYYQISYNYGETWQPRVNLTKSRIAQDADLPHFQPYTDLSILLDSQGDLHIVWAAAYWPTGSTLYVFSRSAILHWSEDVPYIRTAYDATWELGDCAPGVWELTASKPSISECQGKFYVLFTQFNDRPNGVLDDCASGSNPGFPDGAANGELYVTISADNGLTWDPARNLTNSRTPGCDSVGGTGGPCDNDHWATVARSGDSHEAGPEVPVVVPQYGTGGEGWYLDVQYLNDRSAGAAVQSEGYWQEAEVKWFRLQCVDPMVFPNPQWTPTEIGFPAWTKAGVVLDTTISLTNIGNADYNYSVTVQEDPGTLSGWLSYTGFTGYVPAGLMQLTTGDVIVTPAGANPGEIHYLSGRLLFTTTDLPVPRVDSFEVDVIVADTLIPPTWDTIATACTPLALQVRSDGLFGGHDNTKGVGLDYYPVDCDTMATPYLYSGSPVIMWIEGTDTIANWTIYDNNYLTPVGFFPVGHTPAHPTVDSGVVSSSTFVTRDSSIAIEQIWCAPQTAGDCHFVIQVLKISSNDGLAHNDLVIGEAVDWDIPSDTNLRNGSDFNTSLKMIWQRGAEYDDSSECQENDARFGGMKFLGMAYSDGPVIAGPLLGAYTKDNPTWVYGNSYGFDKSELWANMTAGGWSKYVSTAPESLYTDLHTVMTFDDSYDLPAIGALHIYTAFFSIENGSLANVMAVAEDAAWWASDRLIWCPGCCNISGDFNNNGAVQVSDLTALIGFLFRGGWSPPCFDTMDLNNDGRIDISDLTMLVAFLFRGGSALPPCC